MKRTFILSLFIALVLLSACNQNKSQNTSAEQSLDVAGLLASVDQQIDQSISLSGTVNHVCSHSGRRCFLIDSTGEYSIRVEAGGAIESFSKELMGTTIVVKGILKENRLSAAEIDEMEVEVLEKHPEDAESDGETCSAEMSNINKMRAWMKEHGKDYYAIYYVEGSAYELAQ
ncbi:hypothetical protein [Roseimarinus sediminis]|uniref:hypothetical protein n=1 Tax=Roseimarinus sediminis TaxID=1610899 RepID=UPI003D1AAC31